MVKRALHLDMRKAPRGGLSWWSAARSGFAATAGGNTEAGEPSTDKGEGGGFGNIHFGNIRDKYAL